MPLIIIRNDITKMKVDAIVNAANRSLLGGGGVDGAIHRAAGPRLLEECRTLGGCETGEAKLTRGYDLPAKYVIHTVGPIWNGGNHGERQLLANCYRNSLEIAKAHELETVAFPLISAGVYGYPNSEALRVAEETITAFLSENEMTVYMVIFGRADNYIAQDIYGEIRDYIGDRYAEEHGDRWDAYEERRRRAQLEAMGSFIPAAYAQQAPMNSGSASAPAEKPRRRKKRAYKAEKHNLLDFLDTPKNEEASREELPEPCFADEVLANAAEPVDAESDYSDISRRIDEQFDESFTEMLLRKIDEKGMTDVECYKKANIDRKLFSKIRSDRLYKPSKQTVLAFAIALELSLSETSSLLRKAGYALSHASKFDIIVEYFIEKGNYSIMEINEALFAFDQMLLGA